MIKALVNHSRKQGGLWETLPGGARPFMLWSLMERLVVLAESWLFLVRGRVLFTSVPVKNQHIIKYNDTSKKSTYHKTQQYFKIINIRTIKYNDISQKSKYN